MQAEARAHLREAIQMLREKPGLTAQQLTVASVRKLALKLGEPIDGLP